MQGEAASSGTPASKAKAKAKAKASRRRKALGDGSELVGLDQPAETTSTSRGAEAPTKKKGKLSKEARDQLEALKLQSSVIHTQQKWTSRIKSVNVEVTASLMAATEFPSLDKCPV